jgi:ABC-type sugar transport system substrate-binding protein
MRRLVSLLGAVALLGLVGACGSDEESSSSAGSTGGESSEKFVIGYAAGKVSNPTARAGYAGFVHEAEKLGMEVKVNDANIDINKQVADIDQFVNQKVDAIVVHLIGDPNAVQAPLQRAAKAGIKIFSLDGLPPFPGVKVEMIGLQPSEQVGGEQAKWIGEQLKGKGEVAVTSGPQIPLLDVRHKATTATFKKDFPGIELVKKQAAIPDDATGGRKTAEALLQRYADLKAITAVNDDIAAGMGEAAEAAKRDDVLIVGMNGGDIGMQALKEGRIHANWDFNTLKLGQDMAKAARDVLDGKAPAGDEPVVINGEPTLYTKDNVSEWVAPEKQIEYPDF